MKRIICILFTMLLFGCATSRSFRSCESVCLDPNVGWANNTHKNVRSITLRAVNKKYRAVDIKVKCNFKDGTLFGERTVTVEPRDDKVFTVRGFSRVVKETVSCEIKTIR